MTWEIGAHIENPYPFVRQTQPGGDCQDAKDLYWRPGVKPDERRQEYVADGTGAQILTIVGKYKPDGYQERVFYRRQWRDPDGKVFGKRGVLVSAATHFAVIAKGYRYQVAVRP
jgi:hypothetical protein